MGFRLGKRVATYFGYIRRSPAFLELSRLEGYFLRCSGEILCKNQCFRSNTNIKTNLEEG